MSKQKVLVTGGAGYIGSVLVPTLLSHGFKVKVLDNFFYNQTPLLDVCYKANLEVVRGDVSNKQLIKELLREVDIIIPLACLTGAPVCDRYPQEAKAVNLDAIKLLMSQKSKSQKIIFPNTNSGYGTSTRSTVYTEKSPLAPISLYGRLKVEAEKWLMNGDNVISLRLATVFGVSGRMRLDLLVNDFVWRALRDKYIILYEGHFRRNFIHIRDVAGAFLHCLLKFGKMKNQVFNVGLSSANLSKLELCLEIKKQIPDFYFVEARVGSDPDKRDYIVSNEKIEKTGFRTKFSLQKGIRELVKGYQIINNNQFSNV